MTFVELNSSKTGRKRLGHSVGISSQKKVANKNRGKTNIDRMGVTALIQPSDG